MEPLKLRDKVTQHMTRDGLTLDNQTTGESVNVSSREMCIRDRYYPLVKRLHGQVVKLSPTSKNYVNPVSYTHLGVCLHAPVHCGDVVLADVCGTGVDVVATRELPAAE